MRGRSGSADTFELPFRSNPQPMYVYDPRTLRILDVNDATLRFYGYTRAEFLRRGLLGLRPAKDVPSLRAAFKKWGGSERPYSGVWRHLKKDGTPVEMQVFAQTVDWGGKRARLTQVSELAADGLRQAATRTQEVFAGVFATMPDYILRLDRDGTILALNRAREGLSVRQVIGANLFDFVRPPWRAPLKRAVASVFRTARPATLDVLGEGSHGEPCWYSNRIGPIVEDGKVTSALLVAIDVTERREAERERERERQWLASVVAHAPVILFVNDRSGAILLSEGQGLKSLNLRPGQSVGRSVFDPKHSSPEIMAATRRALRGESFTVDLPLSGRVFRTTYTPMRDEAGALSGTIGVATDITDSLRLEGELRASEQRYRDLYARTPAMMHSIDREGRIMTVSDNWLGTFGYTREEVIGKPSIDFLTPASRKLAREVILPSFYKIGSCSDVPYQIRKKDGEVLDVLLSAVAVRDGQGRIERSLAVLIDVTERRRLEREIADAGAREQSKLGRDLHDTVGQTLTGIALLARSLRQTLPAESDQSRRVLRIEELSALAVSQVRGMARGLIPKDLQTLGLGAALEELAQGAKELFGVDCAVSVAGPPHVGHAGVAAQLYHIAQEAVHNAAKHARSPSGVRVSLIVGPRRISLRVTDRGVGLPPLGRRGRGLGLAIMQHRAHSIGATLAARRRPEGGTEIICECPRPGRDE